MGLNAGYKEGCQCNYAAFLLQPLVIARKTY